LGRGKADVAFRDTDISRTNSEIEVFSKDQIFIRDLASTNGTFVNGKKISYSRIKDKDKIQIGATVIEVSVIV
jgi:two-component system cell cycle response regulator